MKEKIVKYSLAFFIPFIILFSCFNLFGIGINGEYDLLMTDSFQQYIVFYHELKRIISEQDWSSLFYNWNLGVGTPFLGTLGYYLSSPLSIFLLLFSYENLPIGYFFLTLIKISLCSLSFYFYLTQTSKHPNYSQLFFSVAYALMAYTVTYHSNIMWLDAVILLPLIITSIDYLIQTNKSKPFFWSLIFLFISNFYTAYMVGIATFLYFIIQLSLHKRKDHSTLRLVANFFKTTLLAIGCCGLLLIPVADAIVTSSQNTSFNLTETPDLVNTFIKFFIGAYDGIDNEGSANLYIGILPIFFLIYAFVSRVLSKQEKISYALFLLFLLGSCFIYPLYLFWHGFKQPIWFPARFSFIISFFILSISYRGFHEFKTNTNKTFTQRTLFVMLMTTLSLLGCYWMNYENIHTTQEILNPLDLMANLCFIGVYGILILLFLTKRHMGWIGCLLTFSIIELDINTTLIVDSFLQSQKYVQKELYSKYMNQKSYYEELPKEDQHIFRIQPFRSDFNNETIYYQQSSLSTFNTLSYHRYNNLLKKMIVVGENEDTQLVDYSCYSPIISHLFGVKYSGLPSFVLGEDYTDFSEHFQVNDNVLPIGYVVSKNILEEIEWEDDPFKNQEHFVNQLIDGNVELFKKIPYTIKENENLHYAPISKDYQWINPTGNSNTESKETDSTIFELSFNTPSNAPIYLNIPNYYNTFNIVNYTLTDANESYPSTNLLNSLYLNRFEPNQTISFKLNFVEFIKAFEFQEPLLYEFNEKAFDSIINQFHQNKLENIHLSNSTLTATLEAKKKGILLLTIPYDKGWKAELNGEEATLLELPNGLMGIEIEPNNYNLTLSYFPPGLKLGIFISFLSIGIGCLFSTPKQIKNEK